MTIRLLSQSEIDLVCVRNPGLCPQDIVSADGDLIERGIPEVGLVAKVEGVGCIFAFEKVDLTRVYAEVSSVYPTCTPQPIPAPLSVWDQVSVAVDDAWRRLKLLVYAIFAVLTVVLVIQSGILRR